MQLFNEISILINLSQTETAGLCDAVEICITKLQKYSSILFIKDNVSIKEVCDFSWVAENEILKELDSLDNTFQNFTGNCLIEISSISVPSLKNIWNNEVVS